ncbi:aspartate carbamoyltransferase [Reinekea marinisedimentorum]|uniref:Aspartate carbamoyltransferase n=1 Tax=Reinekea marinisedimentorum TaxID=230495 RepID=A0A4R3I8W3_9GAMM|nr:aspartate carbamoyltransferase [Reinekea marinisedimentorum]TCS41456.1 aspartate carbamoyltransferase catalytic subunit [Reinekea marinisedimentorum]
MANPLYHKNIVSITDLTKSELELIVQLASIIKASGSQPYLQDKVIASCFFEASTRTRLSFETAVQRLKGSLIGFSDSSNTSTRKGETLSDSITMISSYADAIIMRHPKEGAARLASEVSTVPVINGGDGANQHPTQTLLDLFSIAECQGTLSDLKVAFVGDLKYGRTVHSLAQALSLFNPKFYFIAPEALKMPSYLERDLKEHGIPFEYLESLEEGVQKVDILYMTRVQKERFDPTEYMHIASKYVLTAEMLQGAQANMKVLHPLPRVDEIHPDVDASEHAYYFQQAENGVYARQALLSLVMNEEIKELTDA